MNIESTLLRKSITFEGTRGVIVAVYLDQNERLILAVVANDGSTHLVPFLEVDIV